CGRRPPVGQHFWTPNSRATPFPRSRQAAETCRLAACAPQTLEAPRTQADTSRATQLNSQIPWPRAPALPAHSVALANLSQFVRPEPRAIAGKRKNTWGLFRQQGK